MRPIKTKENWDEVFFLVMKNKFYLSVQATVIQSGS